MTASDFAVLKKSCTILNGAQIYKLLDTEMRAAA